MIGDHYGPTAGRATVLVRTVDVILGTHTARIKRRQAVQGLISEYRRAA